MEARADSFVDNAGPFLRKDVAATLAVTEQVGVDLGLLRSVIEVGPLTLTCGQALMEQTS